ncbi:50S ribosomal protein L5 [Candidatus Falkowbacteria bacterium]|nr:50S ribosomal protein L5 [Candidatus Falkowbacteria bacterium]
MTRLREKYIKEVIPKLKEKFGYKNNLAVPKIDKVVVNVGFNKDISASKDFLERIEDNFKRITGQAPVRTKAKRAISAFKIREDLVIGMMVTLRGERMEIFVDKLVNITLPRFRDFQGLEAKSIDRQGNLTIGVKEHIVFPEIEPDEVEGIHGLEVVVNTTAKNKDEGLELLKLLGFPFRHE